MNVFWLIFVVLFGFILFGTGGPTATTVDQPASAVTVEINGNPGVIFHADTYWSDFANWTPTTDDLQVAEDAIRAAAAFEERAPVLDGYRQYIGIIEDGERKIIVNSMCQEFDGWEENFVQVADGGPCYWTALYNVDTGELEYLVVNGEA